MANASKLPSGAWRTQVSKKIGGKLVRKSFTVHPDSCQGDTKRAKLMSENMAAAWVLDVKTDMYSPQSVEKAIDNYIADRSKILSPSTIVNYQKMKQYFEQLFYMAAADVTTQDIPRIINDMSVSVSQKTIKNRIGFLLSVLDYAGTDRKFKLRYPQKIKRKLNTPDISEVYTLLKNADEIQKAIVCLAAFGSLRRGEICALKQKDISRDLCSVSVHADMVITPAGSYEYKELPKTSDSMRTVYLPKNIIALLPQTDDPEEYLFKMNPTNLWKRYDRLRKRSGVSAGLHDLRHFAASFRSDLNIPSKYIEEVGGWAKDSHIMTTIYDNTLSSTRKKYVHLTNDFIEKTFQGAIGY